MGKRDVMVPLLYLADGAPEKVAEAERMIVNRIKSSSDIFASNLTTSFSSPFTLISLPLAKIVRLGNASLIIFNFELLMPKNLLV